MSETRFLDVGPPGEYVLPIARMAWSPSLRNLYNKDIYEKHH